MDDLAAEFDALYAARAKGLVRSIYVRTGDFSRAQECVQEAFVRAWERWPRVKDQNPTAWVRTAAWHLAVTDWRSSTRETARLRKVNRHDLVIPPVAVAEIVSVREALKTLPEEQQTAIVLHYFEDMAVSDIAELTARPVGTVKSQLHRGRASLRLLLEDAPTEGPQVPVTPSVRRESRS